MRILVFGDSIVQGFWDTYGGWVQRLAHEYHHKTLASILSKVDYKVEVFNLGVSEDTAADILKRIEFEAKTRLADDQETIIVISTGTNDSRLRNNRAFNDVYAFQADVEKIIDKALKITPKVLCVGLSAVNEALTDPLPHSRNNSQFHNNRINTFEDTVKQSAERKNVPFVPIHDQFLAALEAGQDLLADGLHPNEAGHQLMAELVKPVLDELIR